MPPDVPAPVPDTEFVQSLARGLAVITAFSSERPSMTLTEVAQVTGLTRAATRDHVGGRLLRTVGVRDEVRHTGIADQHDLATYRVDRRVGGQRPGGDAGAVDHQPPGGQRG